MAVLITGAADLQAHRFQKFLGTEALFGEQLNFNVLSFLKIPETSSASFIHDFLDLCLDKQIEKAFPLRLAEQKLLAEASQLFKEYGIDLILPDHFEPGVKLVKPDFILFKDGQLIKGNLLEAFNTSGKNGVYCIVESQLQPFALC